MRSDESHESTMIHPQDSRILAELLRAVRYAVAELEENPFA